MTGRLRIVDLRDPVRGHRINVSRRATASDAEHLVALGNPYRPRTPGDTLPRYRQLLARPNADRERAIARIADLARQGADVELGCWCRGASTCHANVIRDTVRELLQNTRAAHQDGSLGS